MEVKKRSEFVVTLDDKEWEKLMIMAKIMSRSARPDEAEVLDEAQKVVTTTGELRQFANHLIKIGLHNE